MKRHWPESLKRLQRKLAAGELAFDPELCQQHSGDKWFASHPPDAVALPRSTRSVAAILSFANEHEIPVTARGAGQVHDSPNLVVRQPIESLRDDAGITDAGI